MRKIIASAALALAVTLTGFPLTSGAAFAQDVELRLGKDGPSVRLRDDCDPRREDCRRSGDRHERHDRDDRRADRRDSDRYGPGCTPGNALNKAQRMGIRRARIADVGRRTVEVVGRNRSGERVFVRFDRRDRRCGIVR